VSVRSAAGVVILVEASGRVFGSDTPGDRQRDWEENNPSEALRQFWMDLRSDAQFETNLDKTFPARLAPLRMSLRQ
jgi:hypothetical protein